MVRIKPSTVNDNALFVLIQYHPMHAKFTSLSVLLLLPISYFLFKKHCLIRTQVNYSVLYFQFHSILILQLKSQNFPQFSAGLAILPKFISPTNYVWLRWQPQPKSLIRETGCIPRLISLHFHSENNLEFTAISFSTGFNLFFNSHVNLFPSNYF